MPYIADLAATGDRAGNIKVFDVPTKAVLRQLRRHNSAVRATGRLWVHNCHRIKLATLVAILIVMVSLIVVVVILIVVVVVAFVPRLVLRWFVYAFGF
jgi:hypothetical protein